MNEEEIQKLKRAFLGKDEPDYKHFLTALNEALTYTQADWISVDDSKLSKKLVFESDVLVDIMLNSFASFQRKYDKAHFSKSTDDLFNRNLHTVVESALIDAITAILQVDELKRKIVAKLPRKAQGNFLDCCKAESGWWLNVARWLLQKELRLPVGVVSADLVQVCTSFYLNPKCESSKFSIEVAKDILIGSYNSVVPNAPPDRPFTKGFDHGVKMSPDTAEKLLTKGDVAKMYGVEVRTIDRWMEDGKIQFSIVGKNQIRFTESQAKSALKPQK
jgi:hypothetical protein